MAYLRELSIIFTLIYVHLLLLFLIKTLILPSYRSQTQWALIFTQTHKKKDVHMMDLQVRSCFYFEKKSSHAFTTTTTTTPYTSSKIAPTHVSHDTFFLFCFMHIYRWIYLIGFGLKTNF